MTLLKPFLMASDRLVFSLLLPICLSIMGCPYWKTMVIVLFQEIHRFPLCGKGPSGVE